MRILMLVALVLGATAPSALAQTTERPAAACVSSSADRAECFVPGDLSEFFHINRDRAAWSGFRGFGRSPAIMGAPSCISRAAGQFDCFAVSTDGSLWSRTSAAGWTSMAGNGAPRSRASCVSIAADQIDCFIRDRMNILSRRTFHRGRWFEWERLPGLIMSDSPHCVVVDDGSLPGTAVATPIWCFARGPRNELWMVTVPRLPSPSAPARWVNLGGTVLSYPSCVAADYGRVYCFVRGREDALWWKQVDPYGGTAWLRIAGVLTSEPACVSYAARRIDCFLRGTDNTMYHTAGVRGDTGGFRFGDFESWGGVLTSAPTPCVQAIVEPHRRGARAHRLLHARDRRGAL
jgi:hypothetical protein